MKKIIAIIIDKSEFLLWQKGIIEKLTDNSEIIVEKIFSVDLKSRFGSKYKKLINTSDISHILRRKIPLIQKVKKSLVTIFPESIPLQLENTENTYIVQEQEVDKISEVDIILNLTSYYIDFRQNQYNKIKVLSFFVGGENSHKYSIGFSEILNNEKKLQISLVTNTNIKGEIQIIEEFVSKYFKLSYAKSVNLLFREAYTLLNKYLKNTKFYNDNEQTNKENNMLITLDFPVTFSIKQKIMVFYKMVIFFIKEFIYRAFSGGTWNIGVIKATLEDFVDKKIDIKDIEWLEKDKLLKNKFIADSFGIIVDNELYILYEEVEYPRNKGYICIKNVTKKSNSEVIINEPFHLSYPYCFEHQNKIFCVPESWENNSISLYEAKEFPNKWEKVKTLIDDIKGVDTSIFFYEDMWWLFTTIKDDGNSYKLLLFYSSDLFGEFKSHPLNPVKLDCRSARNGGKIFKYKNEIYRPTQDYSEKHQGSIILNKIIQLSPNSFREKIAYKISPFDDSKYNHKLHTFSIVNDYIIFDSYKKKCIFSNIKLLTFKINRILYKIKTG